MGFETLISCVCVCVYVCILASGTAICVRQAEPEVVNVRLS